MPFRLSEATAEFLRVARFGLVGGSAALIYAASLLVLVHFLDMGSLLSSAVAYLIAIPFSFLGQKFFTFQSKARFQQELPAFLMLQGFNVMAAMAVTYVAVDVLGLSHYVGIIAVVITVTAISYGTMALKIFRKS